MTFQLCPGISVCDAGPRLVFLDIAADRYFCLTGEAEAALRLAIDGAEPIPADAAALLETLVDRGLLHANAAGGAIACCVAPPVPSASLLDRPQPVRWRAVIHAAAALIASLARLKYRSLAANLTAARPGERVKRTSASATVGHDAILVGIAAAFDAASRWLSVHDRCLAQSLAVARVARRAGVPVTLVIGVALGPFRAHSWVQHGAVVVNDRVETVARYIPILAR